MGAQHQIMVEDSTVHLQALSARRAYEIYWRAHARNDQERHLRTVWIEQLTREIDCELVLLGLEPFNPDMPPMSDDEILSELGL